MTMEIESLAPTHAQICVHSQSVFVCVYACMCMNTCLYTKKIVISYTCPAFKESIIIAFEDVGGALRKCFFGADGYGTCRVRRKIQIACRHFYIFFLLREDGMPCYNQKLFFFKSGFYSGQTEMRDPSLALPEKTLVLKICFHNISLFLFRCSLSPKSTHLQTAKSSRSRLAVVLKGLCFLSVIRVK